MWSKTTEAHAARISRKKICNRVPDRKRGHRAPIETVLLNAFRVLDAVKLYLAQDLLQQ